MPKLQRSRAKAIMLGFATLSVMLFLTGFRGRPDDPSSIARGMSLLGRVYQEIAGNYVEPVQQTQLMKAGIKGMLSTLDPYSSFIDEQERADLDMLTFGKYGGLGISITNRASKYLISAVVDDEGQRLIPLRIGDEILRIDSIRVEGVPGLDLRRFLRGPAGSAVRIVVRRPGQAGVKNLDLTRRDIPVRGMAFSERLDNGVLYIKLDRFTHSTSSEVRDVLAPFLQSHDARGVIIDLRDNSGGLLDAAVHLLEYFAPRGSILVSTRGRHPAYTREYRSAETPLSTEIPLVVLVNGNSASASEIVAGAVQDLDRGVIVGTRTFGKGLVQSVLPLDGENQLKLTTSKYYTPSGRCIQKSDFGKRGPEGVLPDVGADTQQVYRTLVKRRLLRGAGGIEPDVTLADDSLHPFVRQVSQSGALLVFAAERINRLNLRTVPSMENSMRDAFRKHIDSMKTFAETDAEAASRKLLTALQDEGYGHKTVQQAEALAAGLRAARPNRVEFFWAHLARLLRKEFAFQLGGSKLRFRTTRDSDIQLQKALALLRDPASYEVALSQAH